MRRKLFIGLFFVAIFAGVALFPLIAKSSSEPREIVLVARGMSFYLADDLSTANPTLVVSPGERVRFVLRNSDAGLTHDFAVRAWEVAIGEIQGEGVDSIDVTIPTEAGRYPYTCTPHAVMMKGVIEVRADASARR